MGKGGVRSQREAKRFCSYAEGMLANERRRSKAFFTDDWWLQVGIHEAGHAVCGRALGSGLSHIEMHRSDDDKNVAIHGATVMSSRHCEAVWRALRGGTRFNLLRNEATVFAAGVAAERRHSLYVGEPLRARHGAKSDRERIADIAECIHFFEGTKPDAFREQIWREAQRLIATPRIWAAITALGCALADLMDRPEPDEVEEKDGELTATFIMSGQRARAIMRAYGV